LKAALRRHLGNAVPFSGNGYHDHNFGHLPYADTRFWYWGRSLLTCDDKQARTAVFYVLQPPSAADAAAPPAQATLLVFGEHGNVPAVATSEAFCSAGRHIRSAYGLRHRDELGLTQR
jgi:hypothetical protein